MKKVIISIFCYSLFLPVLSAETVVETGGKTESKTNNVELKPSSGYVLHATEGEKRVFPNGSMVITKVDETKTGVPHLAMGIQHLSGEIPLHTHDNEVEILFLHKGQGVGTLGSESVSLQEGAVVYIPAGVEHAYKNVGDTPSQILWLVNTKNGTSTELEKAFRKFTEEVK